MPPPPPVSLSYDIPKNRTASITSQIAKYSSLDLNQGGILDVLNLVLSANLVVDTAPGNPDAPLRRTFTLTAVEPAFGVAFGTSEAPSMWQLQSMFRSQIEQGLATSCVVSP